MGYCSLDNLKDKVGAEELLRLCDDNSIGDLEHAEVAGIWEEAIEAADGKIDAYCMSRYTVPLSPVPRSILDISADITIYVLYSRRPGGMPDNRRERYDDALAFLDKVASGKALIREETVATGISIVSSDKIFSRDKMQGF